MYGEEEERGSVSTALTLKRRIMSSSSGFDCTASSATARGSSAMPQVGHVPEPVRITSGCMGQV
jgi:hypothetical protein